ncbi:MAG: anaerobic ribonucleoside-triphosphate reductase [Clostridia bacterium]|nr:anaerobic ribonucleoside-triphosphate reductase [Clostridia bacterium]
MCKVHLIGGTCPQQEIDAYIARGVQLYGREPDAIDIRLDGEYVELAYRYQNQPFHRIRRITGYLVGTMDRWGNAKRAEERDRVKHGIGM